MKKFTKRTAAFSLAATAALALSACSGDGGSAGGGDNEVPDSDATYVAMVSKGFQHQFWQAVNDGAQEKADELGVEITFEGPASETQVDDQLNMLQTAIDREPDAIAYAALDPEACIPLYEDAESAGIPVVQFDAPCNSDYALTLAATDGVAAGALAADHMAELIGGEGKVGVIGHSQINSTGVERRDGFVNQLEDEYPDIEVVDIQYGDGDHLKSADIAKAMINAHPDLKGLYGTNEGSAIGVVNAANELGLTGDDLTIIGFDSGAAQINAIKAGTMAGAITQDPRAIGAKVVQAAVDVINGESIDDYIDTGSYWYDAENVESDEIQAMLYE
ncbi:MULTISPECIES: ABC transporter substrate-binding protein [Microbacterium]|uniref:ABC transporter substrate-binding protein n=1 Tax=Microbacterium TaxID=33882 RepID=UPI000DA1C248|nr:MULTISPECIES: ABC transporter substrate-binding protein [Microbacterium]